MNKIIIIGNLGTDPEVRENDDGQPYGRVRVATTRRWVDKTTGERREDTEWFSVRLNGANAKVAKDYLKKGSQVCIEGHMKTRVFTDGKNVERDITELICERIELLGMKPKDGAPAQPAQQPRAATEKPAEKPKPAASYRDDLPF
jgi:single-strand DNA-binding protein